jgi:hypothetical protein
LENVITMAKSFTIQFRYPLESLEIYLEAQVELHHSDPYYHVKGFKRVQRPSTSADPGILDVLQPVDVKLLRKQEKVEWVHKDSGTATSLSSAIGTAIEDAIDNPEVSER